MALRKGRASMILHAHWRMLLINMLLILLPDDEEGEDEEEEDEEGEDEEEEMPSNMLIHTVHAVKAAKHESKKIKI